MLKWFGLAGFIIVRDQVTKHWVLQAFAVHEVKEITSFFNMLLVFNKGAAFSLLADAGGWQRTLFIAIAIVASIWIGWLLRRHAQDRVFCLALALILGGALGNVIDRIVIGAVVDFLDFHAGGWHWPAFNVADIGISCGAMLLVYDAFRTKPRDTASNPGRA
jgi:signal peptidase II